MDGLEHDLAKHEVQSWQGESWNKLDIEMKKIKSWTRRAIADKRVKLKKNVLLLQFLLKK